MASLVGRAARTLSHPNGTTSGRPAFGRGDRPAHPTMDHAFTEVSRQAGDARSQAPPVVRPMRRRWGWEVLLVVSLAGILPLLGAAHYHSLGQPTSDDWSYLRTLATFSQHGTFNLNHWGTVFELGQVVVVAPLYVLFGVHPVVAMLWVEVVGAIGLLGLSYLGRHCGVSRNVTLLIVATVGLCPLFFRLDVSFMTDVPSFTLMIIALCLWTGCRRTSRYEWRRWLALGVAGLAFTFREPTALVAVPILLEPLVASHRRGDRSGLLRNGVVGAVFFMTLGTLWVWRQSITSKGWEDPFRLTPSPLLHVWVTGWLPALLGLFMLPVLLTLSPWNLVPAVARRRPKTVFAILSFGVLLPLVWSELTLAKSPWLFQIGNFDAVDASLPPILRAAIYVVGLLSFATCAVIVLGAARSGSALSAADRRTTNGLVAVVIASAAFILGSCLIGLPTWDRYWLVVVALGGLVLDRAGAALRSVLDVVPSRPLLRRWGIGGAMALVALFAGAIYTDSAAANAGEWNFATTTAAHLPGGQGAQDLSAQWTWDGNLFSGPALAGSTSTSSLHGEAGTYIQTTHDGTGSAFFIDHRYVGTCAPWTVVATGDGVAVPAGAVLISQPSRGLFASFRFVLVHKPIKECTYVDHHYDLKP